MNIKQIYQDKKSVIEYSMQEAFNSIFQEIDKDTSYTLSDDEITELVYDLIKEYINN
jgi:isopropylmalate/homocitrate/citramalate synthase